ncbi:MAG TPA: hypothetical protein VGC76_11585 [Pyrinomonadaceae bacterium]|jgi:hypothetical protein
MNIKSLRKNYDQLSKRERFILYDAAENRDDQSEMDAIMLATPNEDWIKPDFALQAEQILKFRLVRLVQRLKHCRDALLWFSFALREELSNEGKTEDHFFYDSARLSAYFYCVNVKTTHSLFEEIGLDIAAWKTKENELFDFDFEDERTDWLLRKIAFDEKEAEAFINKIGEEHNFKNIILGFTYEKEFRSLRDVLKEKGFDEYFKD